MKPYRVMAQGDGHLTWGWHTGLKPYRVMAHGDGTR